ncbi:hopanoid biosynthesis-associated protein HpnK [Anaeroselena agilis]|uniref:Hopanoid biosynthesis-associated protein HpnK n=1 Tax=Anaeroselena agilis TaxID=3063788 RepID=A0ABU3NY96_9FIRM|nr:hopanoid biosynthesis-associated protein HpnK [Selenomonadales bacterium 4137-cl]
MKQLIVNADDFGLHPAVNRAVIAGHTGGCITSTSIMPGAAAFADAALLAGNHPSLGIGVHLTLVGERPVTDPAAIPTLVDSDGRFPGQYPAFLARYLRGRVNRDEIRAELTAQIAKTAAAGIAITHLDSHQHLHVLPGIIDIVLDLAAEFGIKALRIPAEPRFFSGGYPYTAGRFLGRFGLSSLASLARGKARRRGIAVPDHFFGMLAGGNMRQQYLLAILDRLSDGVSEIMVHPGDDDAALGALYGWGYRWRDELAALTGDETLRRLEANGIRLISFRELGP